MDLKKTLMVVPLAWTVTALLLLPTLLGFAVDRIAGTAPWGLVLGATVGIGVAAAMITGTIVGRMHSLAPPATEEDDAQ